MPDYSPFPELELEQLATFLDSVAASHPERSFLRHNYEQRALACRNAVLSNTALRERCLVAEMELGQARAS